MYFPVGWPNVLHVRRPNHARGEKFVQIVCNRDRLLFAVVCTNSISIWYSKPSVPVLHYSLPLEFESRYGTIESLEWRPDSTKFVLVTNEGHLLFYAVSVLSAGIYNQNDSSNPRLRRESSELFDDEPIPKLFVKLETEVWVTHKVSAVVCIRDELMVSTGEGTVIRYKWDGSVNRDYCLDLKRTPFCFDKLASYAIPLTDPNICITQSEYSPFIGGFSVIFNDGRAAFLTASTLKFDPNQIQGIWAPGVDNGTCTAVNHKYRLIAYGRKNSQGIVFSIDDVTGNLVVSHELKLSDKDCSHDPGAVTCIKYTPDGCALALTWEYGGFSLWSVFGSLLLCTLGWEHSLFSPTARPHPLCIPFLEWGPEGYILWMLSPGCQYYDMVRRKSSASTVVDNLSLLKVSNDPSSCQCQLLQLKLVKSALTVMPSLNQERLFLQGEDRLYINASEKPLPWLSKQNDVAEENKCKESVFGCDLESDMGTANYCSMQIGNKQWVVLPVPYSYIGNNWPIRYAACDIEGQNVAVAGKTGFAHYSFLTRRWMLFGNESQERDCIVTGGLVWYQNHIILACYNLFDLRDEIRLYHKDVKLDNSHMRMTEVPSQVLLLSSQKNILSVFCANCHLFLYRMRHHEGGNVSSVFLVPGQSFDLTPLGIHPICIISVTIAPLRLESGKPYGDDAISLLINVCGKLLLVHDFQKDTDSENGCLMTQQTFPTILASCVENIWMATSQVKSKPHLTDSLWLHCGVLGMRVWLPLFPKDKEKSHTFMSKRIMLPVQTTIYPLAVLFEAGILLGVETDIVHLTSSLMLPFCILERTSEVFIHYVLRQLLRRNLGLSAWDIANCCSSLPYFKHALELLLHSVLEEEATSKEPLPDALLPSVIDFIREFPSYLQTVVGCARKSEIALWHHLFSVAGNPKFLFEECLQKKYLDVAANYLIILQNIEPVSASRQHAAMLLDTALDCNKWDLSKDLIRFLKSISVKESDHLEYSRHSISSLPKFVSPTVSPNEEELTMVLGSIQVPRGRSFSTAHLGKSPDTVKSGIDSQSITSKHIEVSRSGNRACNTRKQSTVDNEFKDGEGDDFFIEAVLERHAKKLLTQKRIRDLGMFAAHLDFHLVSWLSSEKDIALGVEEFVSTLKKLHADFQWPFPILIHPVSHYTSKRGSMTSFPSPDSLVSVDEKFSSLLVDVDTRNTQPYAYASVPPKIGDSGYLSNLGGLHDYHGAGLDSYFNTHADATSPVHYEALLRPHQAQENGSNMSYIESEDTSSLLGEGNDSVLGEECSSWGEFPNLGAIETLSHEMANKGPQQFEVQLRYLLQLLLDAGCLEWSLLISILLRDAMAVIRTLNAARTHQNSARMLPKLQEGLRELEIWTESDCVGYKPLMQVLQDQISALVKLSSLQKDRRSSQSTESDCQPSHLSPLAISRRSSYDHTTVDNKDLRRTADFAAGDSKDSYPRSARAEEVSIEEGASQRGCLLM